MKCLYLVTGAAGHLGNTIVRTLLSAGRQVRGLVLPGENTQSLNGLEFPIVKGDITDKDSLVSFCSKNDFDKSILIHTAGIVSIAQKTDENLHRVNVLGTRIVCDACIENNVDRMIYISSVHAIPEKPIGEVITETNRFDPDLVNGAYAKTKAEATRIVLEKVDSGKLDAVVVHPSGIIGPGGLTRSHSGQMILDYAQGRLTASVRGGYDFVDVRDVADGVIAAAEKGKQGDCYLLTNRYFEVSEILEMLHKLTGRRRIRTILPMWFAKGTAALSEIYYKILKQVPLFTSYSLDTLVSNSCFSHEKATRELGYQPRSMYVTLSDTLLWLKSCGILK